MLLEKPNSCAQIRIQPNDVNSKSLFMNNDIEEIEAFLKPTKTKRRLIVVIQSISVALTLLLGFYLFKQIDYLDVVS